MANFNLPLNHSYKARNLHTRVDANRVRGGRWAVVPRLVIVVALAASVGAFVVLVMAMQ